MNMEKLFEMQKVLDEKIIENHPELKGQKLLNKKVLALQVELGECANEYRGFKFWSNDQEPRTKKYDFKNSSPIKAVYKNPLLEEYVDCLHFILSIGLELGARGPYISVPVESGDVTIQFRRLYAYSAHIKSIGDLNTFDSFEYLMSYFLGLGELFGFTWEEIEQAYLDKNKTNHKRQENGY